MKNKQKPNPKQYLEFLEKQLKSENYKNNVTKEQYQETKRKYDREKLKLRLLKLL